MIFRRKGLDFLRNEENAILFAQLFPCCEKFSLSRAWERSFEIGLERSGNEKRETSAKQTHHEFDQNELLSEEQARVENDNFEQVGE